MTSVADNGFPNDLHLVSWDADARLLHLLMATPSGAWGLTVEDRCLYLNISYLQCIYTRAGRLA